MTATESQKAIDTSWIEAFKKAAKIYHDGRRYWVLEFEEKGTDACEQLIRELDATGPNARDFLIPLLRDPDLEIRVLAAGYMIRHRPDLGLSVLKEIDKSMVFEASLTAMHLLRAHHDGVLDI